VTSQPQPVPDQGRAPGDFLRPLRDLAAWVLVAVPAVLLFVAIIRLIPAGDGDDFGTRTQDSFYSFVSLPTIFFPLGAVLLALLIQPRHPKAKVITMVAAVEYVVAGFFAAVFGILVGLIQIAGFSVRAAFEQLLVRAAWLAVFGLAAFAVYKLWSGLFYVAKPKPQPGVYGQPQYGAPGTYPGQPGYGPPPGQPSWNQPAYGQPGYPPPGPGWGQPPASGQPAAPQPVSGYGQPGPAPTSGMPAGPYPPGYGTPGAAPHAAFSEPTQVVPRADGAPDRTEVVRDDRPGFGQADEDPPRH
jgi:hypothetical protein